MRPLKDKKIRIYKTSYTGDDIGNQIPQHTLVGGGPVWAYFRDIGGSEYYAAAQAQIVGEEVLFQVNWRPDYDNTMIVVFRGKVYDVTFWITRWLISPSAPRRRIIAWRVGQA